MKATFFACVFLCTSFALQAADPMSAEVTTEGEEASESQKLLFARGIKQALSSSNLLSDLREGIFTLGELTRSEQGLKFLLDSFKASLHAAEETQDRLFIETTLERHLWAIGSVLTANEARPSAEVASEYSALLLEMIKAPASDAREAQATLAIRTRAMLALGELLMVADQRGRQKIALQLADTRWLINGRVSQVELNLMNPSSRSLGGLGHADFVNIFQKQLFAMLEFLAMEQKGVERFIHQGLERAPSPLTWGEMRFRDHLRVILSASEFIQLIAHSRGLSLEQLAHPDFLQAQRSVIHFDQEGRAFAEMGPTIAAHYAELKSRFEHGALWDATWVVSSSNKSYDSNYMPYAVFHREKVPNPQEAGGSSIAASLLGTDVKYLIRQFPSLGIMHIEREYLEVQDRRSLTQKISGRWSAITSRFKAKK